MLARAARLTSDMSHVAASGSSPAIVVDGLWKSYRLYHERNQYLKAAILRGRRARYEEFWALKGIDLEVPRGSTFGVIGSNGSGKSTLLKCLAGILAPDRGSVTANGRLSALLELGAGFHPELTGRENVFMNGAILGLSKRELTERFDDIVAFSGLEEFIDTPVKNYSSGMFVRLGFAVAAHVEPEILLIDEVLSVGDESFQRRSAEKIDEFRRDGRTIVFVSHGLSQVSQLCETVAWIDKGDLKMVGPADEVIATYKGDSHDAVHVEGERGSRWGSGEVQIVALQVLDGDGHPTTVLNTLEPARVRFELSAHMPVHDVVMGIRLDVMGGPLVWGTSSRRSRATIGMIQGSAWLELEIPSLPLLEGVYDLSASVSDQSESHPYDHWERKIRLEVRQYKSFDSGLVNMPVTWNLAGVRRG
jgi:ABC-type polysaccharide/polyol phosphate transport system ATPase subunit